jgi:hypothetical protein
MMSSSPEGEGRLTNETLASTEQTVGSNSTVDEEQRQQNQESISNRLKEAGVSFKEMVTSLGKKAKTVTEEKTLQLKDKSAQTISPTRRDAHDIEALGINVETVIRSFEETMTKIERQEYDEQEKLLNGYKKLLEEQINVINRRTQMVKRLSHHP